MTVDLGDAIVASGPVALVLVVLWLRAHPESEWVIPCVAGWLMGTLPIKAIDLLNLEGDTWIVAALLLGLICTVPIMALLDQVRRARVRELG